MTSSPSPDAAGRDIAAELLAWRASTITDHDALLEDAAKEIKSLRKWVNNLQSGMFVNCVYCGHQYGPSETTPVSMADVLKAHVEQCPKHPMSALKAQLTEANSACDEFEKLAIIAADTDQTIENFEKQLAEKEKELKTYRIVIKQAAKLFKANECEVYSERLMAVLEDEARAYRVLCAADDGQGGIDPDFTYISKKELSSLKRQLEAIRKQTVEAIADKLDERSEQFRVHHILPNEEKITAPTDESRGYEDAAKFVHALSTTAEEESK